MLGESEKASQRQWHLSLIRKLEKGLTRSRGPLEKDIPGRGRSMFKGTGLLISMAGMLRVYVVRFGVVAADKSEEVIFPRLQRVLYAQLGNLNFTFCPGRNGQITGGLTQWVM